MCLIRPPLPLFSIKLLVLSYMIYALAGLGRGAERESQPGRRPQIVLDARATAISFSADGKVLATAGDDKTVRLWDAAAGKPLHALKSHTLPVGALAFSPDGKLLASAGAEDKRPGDFELKLWDTTSGTVVHEVFEKEYRSGGDAAPPMPFLAFSPDGALLVFPGKNRTLCLWDIKAQKEKWSLKIGLVPSTAAFSPDGKFLAIGTHTSADHGSARIIHSETGKPERGLWFWYNGALQLAYSADGKQIFGGFRQKVLRRDLTEGAKVNHPGDAIIWDASKGPRADAMAFCSGGRLVALRAGDELTVVDTQSGQPKLTVKGASGPIALSPDGRRLAVSCQHGTTEVWDIRRCTVAADPRPEVDVRAEDGKVLIAADQIRSYDWATHTLTLAPKVREELAKRLRKDQLVSGIPFAVTVGATVVYQGSFTTIESSRSFSTPVIVVDAQAVEPKLGADQLRIQLGYPTAEFYKGEDPRADRRIREALKASNKEPPPGSSPRST